MPMGHSRTESRFTAQSGHCQITVRGLLPQPLDARHEANPHPASEAFAARRPRTARWCADCFHHVGLRVRLRAVPVPLTTFFFFKQKTAYEIGLGIPAEPLLRSWHNATMCSPSLRQNCVTVFSFSKNHFSSPSGRWSIVLLISSWGSTL